LGSTGKFQARNQKLEPTSHNKTDIWNHARFDLRFGVYGAHFCVVPDFHVRIWQLGTISAFDDVTENRNISRKGAKP